MTTIRLLNHGHVRLVDHMGSDLSVVRNARVSYDAEWRAGEDEGKDAKLIDYLVKNKHTSPLEAVNFTFDVKAPIFVARQWMRHRTGKFSEISARYAQLPDEFYDPELDQITTQHTSNKQMRTDEQHPAAAMVRKMMYEHNVKSFELYKAMLKGGVPRELARTILPLGTYTHFFYTVDLHNLMKFIQLRDHAHAQFEIRVYAQAMLGLIEPLVPVTVAAFRKHWLAQP